MSSNEKTKEQITTLSIILNSRVLIFLQRLCKHATYIGKPVATWLTKSFLELWDVNIFTFVQVWYILYIFTRVLYLEFQL